MNDQHVSFLVMMTEQADTPEAARRVRGQSTATNPRALATQVRQSVVQALRTSADRTQMQLAGLLAELEAQGHISHVEPLWVVNALSVTGDQTAMQRLAERSEVAQISPNRAIKQFEPEVAADSVEPNATTLPWNLSMIGAGEAWNMGADGTGVVVGIIDSGVDVNHPALRTRFRGYDPANPAALTAAGNWIDLAYTSPLPVDSDEHGTHVTGSILGYDPATDKHIGVAPGARWIAARVFDVAGNTTDGKLLSAGQWMLAPTDASGQPNPALAPDIINNSWGSVTPGLDEFYLTMVRNWRAAGIVPVFSAGNEGELGPASVTAPGNYPESFSVAAVDSSSRLAYFSSRGPSPYGSLIKPNVSAPGVYINSALPGGYYGSMSGTSMASPHVAGALAVLLSANPALSVAQLESVLTQTATPRTDAAYPQAPNFGYGHGIINVAAAVTTQASSISGVVTSTATSQPVAGATLRVTPGDLQTTSRADGTYTLYAPAGAYTLTVTALGFEAYTTSVTLTTGQRLTLPVALTPVPPGYVGGTVTDAATGAALQGATLQVAELPELAPVLTGPAGDYRLALPAGTYTVQVQAPKYLPKASPATVTSGQTTTLNFALSFDQVDLDDWPQYRGGPGHTNYNESLLAPPLQKVWPTGLNMGSSGLPPVVAADRVFVSNSNDRKVYGLDLNTGATLWSTQPFTYSLMAPAYVQGLVIVGTSDGKVHAIDAGTGVIRWSKALSSSTYGGTVPAVAQDRIFINGNYNGTTYALDLAGNLVWQSATGGYAPMVAGDLVFLEGSSGKVTALDRATGAQRWQWSCPCYSIQAGLTFAEGLVLAVSDSTMYALDAATGQLRWQVTGANGSPAVWDGHAYMPKQYEKVARVRLSDGQVVATLDANPGSTATAKFTPRIAGGLLWVSGPRALDPVTGQVLWSYAGVAGSFPLDLPVIASNRLLVTEGGFLTALAPSPLPDSATFKGRLLDSATGLPLPYLAVRLEGTSRVAVTDAAGYFALLARPDTYTAVVEKYGHITLRQQVTLTAAQPVQIDLLVQPTPRGTVTGSVYEAQTGLAVGGATLWLKEDGRIAPVEGAPDGLYRIDAYQGDYTLAVTAPGYFSREIPVSIPAGGQVEVPIGLTLVRQRPDSWVSEYGLPDHQGSTESFVAPPLTNVWSKTDITVATNTRPIVAGGRVFASASDGTLRAYDLASGQQLWSIPVGTRIITPAFDQETVYVTNGEQNLLAVNAADGSIRWSSAQISQSWTDNLTAAGGRVFVFGSGSGADLFTFDGTTGALLWRQDVDGTEGSPAVAGGVVYVSGYPTTYAFDAATGQLLWKRARATGSGGGGQAAVVAGDLLLEIDTTDLFALDLKTGALKWTRPGFSGTPVFAAGVIYANLSGGIETVGLRPEDGQEVWRAGTSQKPVSGKLAVAGGYLFAGTKASVVNLSTKNVTALLSAATTDTGVIVAEDRVVAVNGGLHVYKSSNAIPTGLLHGRVVNSGIPSLPLKATITAGGRTYTSDLTYGAFSARLAAGTQTITVSAPGWQPVTQQVSVAAGSPTYVLIQLQPEARSAIYGIVTDSETGLPVESARIRLMEAGDLATVYTGADGLYEIRPFAGTYTLQVSAPGYRNGWATVTVAKNSSVNQPLSLIPGSAGDCPADRCSGDRSGVSNSAGLPPFTQMWTSHITSAGFNVQSNPIIARGIVYAGGETGTMTAMSLLDGKIIWERGLDTMNGAPPESPAYGDGMLFVTANNGQAYGLNAATGATIWQKSLSSDSWDVTAPLYDGTRVYTMVAGQLYALDPVTGQQLWKTPSATSTYQLAMGGGRVYAGWDGPGVKAVNPETGAQLWSVAITTGKSSPRVSYADEVVLVAAGSMVWARDAATGAALWETAGNIPTVKDGVVYHLNAGVLYARNLKTGAMLWSMAVTVHNPTLEPTITGDLLILGAATVVDLKTRSVVWSFAAGDSAPVVAGDGYLVMDNSDWYGYVTAWKGAVGSRNVTAQFALEGRSLLSGITATLTGNGVSYGATTSADGKVTFGSLLPGTYTLRGSYPSYLRKTQTVTVGSTDVTVPSVTLWRGDIDQNGVVDTQDITAILSFWRSTDGTRDLSGDGVVDMLDLFLLQKNLGKSDQ